MLIAHPPAGDILAKTRTTTTRPLIGLVDTVMLTRQEIITSLHESNKYILAIVEVDNNFTAQPRYIHGAQSETKPAFEQTAIQYNLKRLMERAEHPSRV